MAKSGLKHESFFIIMLEITSSYGNTSGHQPENGTDVIYAINYNEKKKMFVMPYSPVKVKVIISRKGETFKEKEETTIFAYGGYLKYRDLERSFDPEDSEAKNTQKSMTEKRDSLL